MNWIKYIILFLIFLLCSGNASQYYENLVPGLPIGGGKTVGGLYKKVKPKCSHKISPVDTAKEEMTVEAYDRLSKGISIFIISLIISIAFSNPLTHAITNIGMGLGGGLFILGIVKLFVATYLTWIIIGVVALVIIAIVYRLRGSSILNAKKWIGELKDVCGNKTK